MIRSKVTFQVMDFATSAELAAYTFDAGDVGHSIARDQQTNSLYLVAGATTLIALGGSGGAGGVVTGSGSPSGAKASCLYFDTTGGKLFIDTDGSGTWAEVTTL